MAIEQLTRVFKYGSLNLEDPGREMSAQEVKDFYADVYPELTQAGIEGPDYKDLQEVYEFKKAVGTKGWTVLEASELELEGEDPDADMMKDLGKAFITNNRGSKVVEPPSEILGVV
jgi:PRTRC genetic system protein C